MIEQGIPDSFHKGLTVKFNWAEKRRQFYIDGHEVTQEVWELHHDLYQSSRRGE